MAWYRTTGKSYGGFEFEVEDGASEDEIAREAERVVMEHVSFGWEECEAPEWLGGRGDGKR